MTRRRKPIPRSPTLRSSPRAAPIQGPQARLADKSQTLDEQAASESYSAFVKCDTVKP